MMAEERRERIAAALVQRGSMSIADITAQVGCSVATARRDLDTLARLGQVRRSRGGAMATPTPPTASAAPGGPLVGGASPGRATRRSAEPDPFALIKGRIARAAADLVMAGDSVGLSGGTTTLEVARCLRGRSLGLVTNALDIARELASAPGASAPGVRVVLIGGVLNADMDELVGPLAEDMLARIRVDTLFLSVDGVSAEAGATIIGDLEAPVVRAFAARARRVVIVADQRKIGRTAVIQVLPLVAVEILVTDAGPSPAREAIEGAGVRVIAV